MHTCRMLSVSPGHRKPTNEDSLQYLILRYNWYGMHRWHELPGLELVLC